MQKKLMQIFDILLGHFGEQHWWPAQTPFEMMVGAVLTQAVAWRNVEKAIANLEGAALLDPAKLYSADIATIETLIRPTRYYRMKTKKLLAFVTYFVEKYRGDLTEMSHRELPELRRELLSIYGMGPETADCILLYGVEKPIFVIDEYTRRIFGRLGISDPKASYHSLQKMFMDHLKPDVALYNEYHAVIVRLGNRLCQPDPLCEKCPLKSLCRFSSGLMHDQKQDKPTGKEYN